MNPPRGLFCLLALLLMFSSISAAPLPQEDPGDPRFFEKTRHWVAGEFLALYTSVDDPERVFGAPITDEFDDVLRPGYRIQYFERVRMDYDPNKPAGKRVALAPLGEWLFDETQQHTLAPTAQNNGLCREFGTGKQVCYAFLQFYDLYGGADLFGLPVSDLLWMNNRYTQYFQNVRLEWRIELPAGQRVVVSELGSVDFESRIGNPELRRPSLRIPQSVTRVPAARAFVTAPLVSKGAQQRVDVIVRDQFLQPIPGQTVTMTVTAPGGEPRSYTSPEPTGDDGLATIRFLVEEGSPNQVIEVRVDIGAAQDGDPEAVTWFRIWW